MKDLEWAKIHPHVIFANILHAPSQFTYGPRVIEDHQFIYVYKGKGIAQVEDREYDLEAGVLIYYGPNVRHRFVADQDDPFVLYGLHFRFSEEFSFDRQGLVKQHFCDLEKWPPVDEIHDNCLKIIGRFTEDFKIPEYIQVHRTGIEQLLQMMLVEYEQQQDDAICQNRANFMSLLVELYRLKQNVSSEQDIHHNAVLSLQQQLEKMVEAPYDRQWLSHFTQYHPDHAAKLFRQALGCSPHDYHQQQKITKAKQWLSQTAMTITEIAESLKFSSIHYFSRRFKQDTGLSPLAYRKVHRMI